MTQRSSSKSFARRTWSQPTFLIGSNPKLPERIHCGHVWRDIERNPAYPTSSVSSHFSKRSATHIGRLLQAAERHQDAIVQSTTLQELLTTPGPLGSADFHRTPEAFLPGPLEGARESTVVLPSETEEALRRDLAGEEPAIGSFVTLANCAFFFKIEPGLSAIVAEALRKLKDRVRNSSGSIPVFPLLAGTAVVAAATRGTKIADELRLIARSLVKQTDPPLKVTESLRLSLTAAASYDDLKEWCDFLGEWITELAFHDLGSEDASILHSQVLCLCGIVPQLWHSLGRAEAALASLTENS